MKYRKLRIAWSVGCGILCLLLVVLLWVRSYSIRDSAYWETDKLWMEINSIKGHVVLFLTFRPGDGQVKIRHEKITPNDEARVKDGILGFFYFREEDTAGIHVPFWFLALAFMAAAAVVPWIWPRRFSLRTLLVAMTVVAVLLGVFVWAVK